MDPHTKFQLNRPKIAEVIPYFHFWLVGRLGRSAQTDFHETFVFKAAYPSVPPCKKSRGWLKAFSRYSIFKIVRVNELDSIDFCSIFWAKRPKIGIFWYKSLWRKYIKMIMIYILTETRVYCCLTQGVQSNKTSLQALPRSPLLSCIRPCFGFFQISFIHEGSI